MREAIDALRRINPSDTGYLLYPDSLFDAFLENRDGLLQMAGRYGFSKIEATFYPSGRTETYTKSTDKS